MIVELKRKPILGVKNEGTEESLKAVEKLLGDRGHCNLYKGDITIKIFRRGPEAKTVLLGLGDWLIKDGRRFRKDIENYIIEEK